MPDVHPADGQLYPVKPEIAAKAHVTSARYQDMFEHAARDPDGFWAEQSHRIAWMKPPTKIKDTSFGSALIATSVTGLGIGATAFISTHTQSPFSAVGSG